MDAKAKIVEDFEAKMKFKLRELIILLTLKLKCLAVGSKIFHYYRSNCG